MYLIKFMSALILVISCTVISDYCQAAGEEKLIDLSLEELMHVRKGEAGKGIFTLRSLSAADKEIRIGVIVPLTEHPKFARQLIRVIDVAAKRLNQYFEGFNKTIVPIFADDNGDSEVALELSQELIESYQVIGLIGPVASNRVIKIAEELTIRRNVPLISPSATSDFIRNLNDDDTVFQMLGTDNLQAQAMAKFIVDDVNQRNILIIHSRSFYGSQIKNALVKALNEKGVTQIDEQSVSTLVNYNSYNLTDDLKPFLKKRPGSIALLMTEAEAIPVFQSIIENIQADWSPYIVASEAIYLNEYKELLPEAIKKCTYFSLPSADKELFHRLKVFSEEIGLEIEIVDTAVGYDGFLLMGVAAYLAEKTPSMSVAGAIRRLTSKGPTLDHWTLANIKDGPDYLALNAENGYAFKGLSGRIRFDSFGVNINSLVDFWSLQNNQLTLFEGEKTCSSPRFASW